MDIPQPLHKKREVYSSSLPEPLVLARRPTPIPSQLEEMMMASGEVKPTPGPSSLSKKKREEEEEREEEIEQEMSRLHLDNLANLH